VVSIPRSSSRALVFASMTWLTRSGRPVRAFTGS
jgi:hypothetical protein